MKKVSVIIPCYNATKWLPKCFLTLVSQTIGMSELELIFVDDASTDDGATYAMLQEFERAYPEQILVIYLEKNMRQGGARNIALQYASGEYIAFVDADDFKSVNDTYGHEFGDQVLIRIAQVLEEECPQQGYVCRYGGDEFIGFFPYATSKKAQQYTDRVQSRLTKENIMISIGEEQTYAGGEETIEENQSHAEQNMYRQKQMRKESRKNID